MRDWIKGLEVAAWLFFSCAVAGVAWQAVQRPGKALAFAAGMWALAGLLKLVRGWRASAKRRKAGSSPDLEAVAGRLA